MKSTRMVVRAVALSAALSAGASAGLINIMSDVGDTVGDAGVTFTGTVDYIFNGGTSGTLNVSLTNTSATLGGLITGFVFNAGDSGVTASLTSTNFPLFVNLVNPNGAPFGSPFVGGAALGGNFEGGGNPNNGIGLGQTGNFVFAVNGANAGVIDSSTFLTGPYDFNFIVRFRATNGPQGSSKAPATFVPAPGAASLALAGLAAGLRRRR